MVHSRLVIAHGVVGIVFAAQGMWHLFNTIYSCAAGEQQQKRPWHPAKISVKPTSAVTSLLITVWREAELQVLLWGTLVYFAEAFWNGFIDARGSAVINFQHFSLVLFIALYAVAAIAVEPILNFTASTSTAVHLISLLHLLQALAFAHALLLIHTHGAAHGPAGSSGDPAGEVEHHYHWLLEVALAGVVVCCSLRIAFPQSFVVCFAESLAMVMQGAWSVLLGVFLWVPEVLPMGCKLVTVSMGSADSRPTVFCDSAAATLRATTIATLQFSCLLAVVVSLGVGSLLLALYLCILREKHEQAGEGLLLPSARDDDDELEAQDLKKLLSHYT
ncbi:hypothetical protein L7F22_025560 [Adiantum nelumboides]|nr:hypothetical protein [Adiantum nelumboides]